VGALGLNDRYAIYGTLMGRIMILNLADKNPNLACEFSSENITGIVFENTETFHVAIGDYETQRYIMNINSSNSLQIPEASKNNDENFHNANCKHSFTILNNKFLFMIYLNLPTENEINVKRDNIEIKIKNILTNNIENINLEMCNYSVPFDFDGVRFVWVEFLNEKERCLCVYNFEKEKKYEKNLDKNFGHISHCKILTKDKIFIVRKFDECEILLFENDFKVDKNFKNPGDEVIAIDVFNSASKPIASSNENGDFDQIKIMQKDKYDKIAEKQMPRKLDIEMNNVNVNVNKQIENENNENICEENLSISLLDLEGNVSVYENHFIGKRFNMYDIKDISKDHKSKQFFSMGYPYFIKQSHNFFSISTDHGVFIIKKEY